MEWFKHEGFKGREVYGSFRFMMKVKRLVGSFFIKYEDHMALIQLKDAAVEEFKNAPNSKLNKKSNKGPKKITFNQDFKKIEISVVDFALDE